MAKKLDTGDAFPRLSLTLAGGGSMTVPDDLDSEYAILLFYRGHWWPYCRRQLVGYEERLAALQAIGATVVAGSVDDAEKAGDVAAELSFPVAHGMTRADGDAMGSWWEERRGIIQPSEFVVSGGKVLSSTYSSGPVGRLAAADVVRYLTFLESRKTGG